MLTKKHLVYLILAVAALVVFTPRSLAQTISCSSDDGNRHYCELNGGGHVRLAQQRSDSPCREGESWGSDGRGVWVDHGCRADFVVEGHGDHYVDHDRYRDDNNGYGQGQIISCSSDDMHKHFCPADTHGGVRLVKQHSDSSCSEGHSWGYNHKGIWVNHGCRADFEVGR
jgi:Protein of unknown function (DUF3011)